MKEKIQKAVEEYADKHFLDDVEGLLNKPWPEAKELYKKMLADFAREVLSGPLSQKNARNCDTDSHISTGINTSQESGKLNEDNFAKILAREYAEWMIEDAKCEDLPNCIKKTMLESNTEYAEEVIRWLLRRFCFVEKEAINNAYQQVIEQGKHAHVRCQVESRAKLRLLESLFPEIAKEAES